MYRGRADAQHPVDVVVVDGGLNCASVNGLDSGFVFLLWHDAICEEVSDVVDASRAEGLRGVQELLVGPHAGLMDGGNNNAVVWVAGPQGTDQELLTQHAEMDLDWKQLGLSLEVCLAGHKMATRDDPHGRILETLESLDLGRRGVGEPDGGSIGP